ncbi:hypothetical protein D9M71_456790 [compost metagenome]
MFHLHRFQHHQRGAGLDVLAGFDQHADDAAVHRRGQPAVVGVAGLGLGDRIDALHAAQFAGPLQVQAVAAADRQVLAAQAVLLDHQLLVDQLRPG